MERDINTNISKFLTTFAVKSFIFVAILLNMNKYIHSIILTYFYLI